MHPHTPEISGFAFIDEPLDRADALRDDAQALARLWPLARILVLDEKGDAFADPDGGMWPLTGADIGGGPGTAIFLGMRGDQAWFAVDAEAIAAAAPQRVDLRRAGALWPAAQATCLPMRAACPTGRRGRVTAVFAAAGSSFAVVVSSAIARNAATIIIHGGSGGDRCGQRWRALLLGRQATWQPRRYSVIAGFVEPGESLEQTVAREVYEETRVRVRGCRYLGAQPWPFPGALMLGFGALAEPIRRKWTESWKMPAGAPAKRSAGRWRVKPARTMAAVSCCRRGFDRAGVDRTLARERDVTGL